MRKLIILPLILLFNNAFAECSNSKNYHEEWKITKDNAQLNLWKKDKSNITYYQLKDFYLGFKIISLNKPIEYNSIQKIPENLNSYRYGMFPYHLPLDLSSETRPKMEKEVELFFIHGDNISTAMTSASVSTIYEIPFEKKYRKEVKEFAYNFDIPGEINFYKILLNHNNIYNKQKIKFYVKLIESADLKECAYFESTEIEYDFGMKPLSLVWKDFWNK